MSSKPRSEWTPQDHQLARATAMLPPWFCGRMMTDVWWFGILLRNGRWVLFSSIERVTMSEDDAIWIDVILLSKSEAQAIPDDLDWLPPDYIHAIADDRRSASIATSHVMLALDLATS